MKSWLFPLMAAVIGAVFVIAGFGDVLRHGILLLIATAVVVLILLTMERTGDPLSRREVADMLRQVLDGTMDWYLWDHLTSISLRHDPLLEFVQFESSLLMEEQYLCGAATGHSFNEKGLQEIRRLLEVLEQAERWRAEVRPPQSA